jgi:hypothetical protein
MNGFEIKNNAVCAACLFPWVRSNGRKSRQQGGGGSSLCTHLCNTRPTLIKASVKGARQQQQQHPFDVQKKIVTDARACANSPFGQLLCFVFMRRRN